MIKLRIYLSQLNPIVGDLTGNTQKIIDEINKAQASAADVIVFSELCLTGYPPEDLLLLPQFIESVEIHLQQIIQVTQNISVILGLPRRNANSTEKSLFNSAALITNQALVGYYDKILLPTYDVFDERRYFEPGKQVKDWIIAGKKIVITICEDIWEHSKLLLNTSYQSDPVIEIAKLKADCVFNLSASPFHLAKPPLRLQVTMNAAKTMQAPLILCNQVGGNDSLIFDGYSLVINEQGSLCQIAKGFETDHLIATIPLATNSITASWDNLKDLNRALVLGLKDYFSKSNMKKACIGLSGGVDSALVACLAVEALGKENVLGILMPSRFSSEGSIRDANELAENLGIRTETISIEQPFEAYLQLLAPTFQNASFDVTEENLQARIRGMILMAISNKWGYIVLSTGNKSELAMGYSTLYGDMCGGLAVISDLTKQQVYALSHRVNKDHVIIPKNTIEKPPSAELRPNQKDSDSLPDYSIIDHVLQDYIEKHESASKISERYKYPLELVEGLIKRIHNNEYKRRQSPPGLRVSPKAFAAGRRFPIVQKWV